MNNKHKLIEKAEVLKKGLKLLGRNRKTVLSHHKTFELTDELEARICLLYTSPSPRDRG